MSKQMTSFRKNGMMTLKRIGHFDDVTSELLSGGIAAALALFVVTFIRYHLHEKYKILEHPYVDLIGIILGTISVVFFYSYLVKTLPEN